MFSFVRKHVALCTVVFLDLAIILGVVLLIMLHGTKTSTIDFMVAPSGAEISVNGQVIERNSSYNTEPGDCHIVISMNGMQTKEIDITLEDDEHKTVKEYLEDEGGGFSYYTKNPNEIVTLEQVADEKARKFLDEYNKLSSIRNVLPLTFSNTYDSNSGEIVSISIKWGQGGSCEKNDYCLVITDFTGKNHEKALSMIREAGFNPDDYELVFKEDMSGE